MDVVRIRRKPQVARLSVWAIVLATGVAAAVWALPVLLARPAANQPTIARDALSIDTVTMGSLERTVRAAGILAPDRVRVVATAADGIVTDLTIRPGSRVVPETIIARLQNPDLNVAVADVAAQLEAARADVQSARAEAASARLDDDSAARSARAEDARAAVEATADTDLHAKGLIGDLQYRSAVIKSSEDRDLVSIATSKVSAGAADAAAKVAAAQARVDQLLAELAAKRAQLNTLTIVAGTAGVVQSVAVDPGQRVTSGTEFVRVADDRDLKAVLQVAEGDLHGVSPGMRARILTGDGSLASGRVTRFAPSAQNGTVAVDVALDRLPPGARADQNVDGTIVLARVARTLSLQRPATGSEAPRGIVYRLDRDETHAYRTAVTFASGSDERVRILSGLGAGDRVIVSDTSAFDAPILHVVQ